VWGCSISTHHYHGSGCFVSSESLFTIERMFISLSLTLFNPPRLICGFCSVCPCLGRTNPSVVVSIVGMWVAYCGKYLFVIYVTSLGLLCCGWSFCFR